MYKNLLAQYIQSIFTCIVLVDSYFYTSVILQIYLLVFVVLPSTFGIFLPSSSEFFHRVVPLFHHYCHNYYRNRNRFCLVLIHLIFYHSIVSISYVPLLNPLQMNPLWNNFQTASSYCFFRRLLLTVLYIIINGFIYQ